jgi:ankyrin repeat protein
MEIDAEVPSEIINQFVGAAHGNFNVVKALLEQYPAVLNKSTSEDETAIKAAAHTGQKQIAEYLVESGAPLDICTAALLGMTEKVDEMLAGDPDLLHATGAHGIPLMFYAGMGGDLKMAELLFRHGADLNAGDGIISALHGAVFANSPEVCRWLLSHGARPEIKDNSGKTPLEMAIRFKRLEVEEAFRGSTSGA